MRDAGVILITQQHSTKKLVTYMTQPETQQSDGPPLPDLKSPPTPIAKSPTWHKAKYNKMAAQAATYLSSRMFGTSSDGAAATKYLMKNLPTVVGMNQIAFLDLGQRIVRSIANCIEKKADPADKASMVKSAALLIETMQRACDTLRDNKPNPTENPATATQPVSANENSSLPPLAPMPVRANGSSLGRDRPL